MTAAPPPPAPPGPGPETGFGGPHPPPLNMNLPRFHPIAMNPHGSMAPEHLMQNQQPQFFRHYGAPAPDNAHPQPSPPALAQLDHIEARLRQLEQDEAARMAARSHLLAMRKREDEEFRRVTEHAEFEEEELRRQRKRLKRESMGLNYKGTVDSPPMRPEPAPRRLSETSAATTLAFFKQQSPPEPRPAAMAQQAPPPAPLPPPPPPAPPQQQQQQQQQQQIHQDGNGAGSMRRRQKYTIKNVEAWGERHGRPAAHDPSGRALWRRPSDGNLVYLTCPVSGCGKSDFVTLHGFMCHLTKKHKDRTLGSQSRALEVCGVIFDPNAPPPPPPPTTSRNRASTDDSRLESSHEGGYQQELEYSSDSDDGHEHGHGHDASASSSSHLHPVKSESTERPMMPGRPTSSTSPPVDEDGAAAAAAAAAAKSNGSMRQSISSIIDRNPESDASGKGPAHGSYAAEDSRHAVDGEVEGDGHREVRLNGNSGHST